MYKPYATSFSMPKPYQSTNMPKTFPEDIECIVKAKDPQIGSIYISNVQAAANPVTLKRLKIGSILTCAKGYQQNHPKSLIPYYKYIEAVDHEQCKISVYFQQAVDFIDSCVKKTNILVHCIAGVSRSVSMVIAYFIRQHNMTYDEAYRLVKSKRKIIHPNDGFIAQLRQYEKKIKSRGYTRNKTPDRSQGERSLERSVQKSINFEKYQDNFYADKDKLKSIKSKEYTPTKSASKGDNYLDKYKSNQLQKYSYTSKYQIPVSLQQIPHNSYSFIETQKNQVLTPKTKNIDQKKIQRSYQIPRATTNYYTPAKQIPRQPFSYTYTTNKYKEDPITVKLQQDAQRKNTMSPPKTKQYAYQQPIQNNYKNRQQFFDSMNTQLNNKIQKIRQKYQLQRQKLYSKYQNIKTNDKQYQNDKSLKGNKYDNHYQNKYSFDQNIYKTPQRQRYPEKLDKTYERSYKDYAGLSKDDYQNAYKTDTKKHSLQKNTYEPYESKYSKNYLNQQQIYSKKFERTATTNNFTKINNYPQSRYNNYPSSNYKNFDTNRYSGYLNNNKTKDLSFYDQPYNYRTFNQRYY